MQWDLGLQGLAVLGAMSLALGAAAGLLVGKDLAYRLWACGITTVACFGVGLFTSEVLFGWATEEELQPNIDGLSWDEVFLSGLLVTTAVVLVMRYAGRHREERDRHRGGTPVGRFGGRPHHP